MAPAPAPTPTPPATPTATPVETPEAPVAAPEITPAPVPARPEVRTLTLSGALRGRSGKLQAIFTVTRGTPVRVSIARRGHATAAEASWSLSAHAGANKLRLTRRVGGRTLARGRYTLRVAAGGSARTASFTVR
jgi:hypothetical protein